MPTLAEQDSRIAIIAESLYLANLLLLPGFAFAGLLYLFLKQGDACPPIARAHLAQTFRASLWAGFLLIAVSLLIVAIGGFDNGWTWVILITYFTIGHSTLIIFGIVGLSKAIAGQCWRFPLVGQPLPKGCQARQ